MSKKFIRLKDKQGNTLYPSAYKDDLGYIISQTYLKKTGRDSYIYKAWVETYQSSEGEIIQKLVLVNRNDPDHPIEFYGSGSSAIWGLITGDINKQTDLTAKISSSIELQFVKKNKIYIQDTEPVNTSEITLTVGDLWYVTGDVTGYIKGKWYTYTVAGWVVVTDKDIVENTTKITATAGKLETEVSERKAGEAATHSIIEQTAQHIMSVVETKNTIYRQDDPPEMSSEQVLYNGDLWFCTKQENALYKYNKWYIYRDGNWEEATDDEIVQNKSAIEQTNTKITTEVKRLDGNIETANSKIDQQADRITTEVKRLDEDIATTSSKIDQTASSIRLEVKSVENKADNAQSTADTAQDTADAASTEATEAAKLAAAVDIKADGISTEVSKKVGNNEIISKINQSAESITIQASKLNLTGYLTISAGDSKYDTIGSASSAVNTLESEMSSGSTVIHGGCITANTLSISNLKCKGDSITIRDSNNNLYGYIGYGYGSTSSATTQGVILKASDLYYTIVTSAGVRLQAGNGSLAVTSNKLILSSEFYGSTLPSNPGVGQIFFYTGS